MSHNIGSAKSNSLGWKPSLNFSNSHADCGLLLPLANYCITRVSMYPHKELPLSKVVYGPVPQPVRPEYVLQRVPCHPAAPLMLLSLKIVNRFLQIVVTSSSNSSHCEQDTQQGNGQRLIPSYKAPIILINYIMNRLQKTTFTNIFTLYDFTNVIVIETQIVLNYFSAEELEVFQFSMWWMLFLGIVY